MFYQEAVAELKPFLASKRLTNVCVGVVYTVSTLSDGSAGISHTVPEGDVPNAGEILSMKIEDILSMQPESPIVRTITTSILSSWIDSTFERGDPLETLEGGRLCVFGYSPGIDSRKFSSVVVYDFSEPTPQTKGNVTIRPYSSFQGETCNHAVVFGSAIVNGQIDRILAKVTADNLVLTGASSVYAPVTLRKYGFTMIGKVVPIERAKALRVACEGGGAPQMAKYVGKFFKKL
ncbi:MAG: Rossmann-like domain-containing protein [Thermoprotei archaeon]